MAAAGRAGGVLQRSEGGGDAKKGREKSVICLMNRRQNFPHPFERDGYFFNYGPIGPMPSAGKDLPASSKPEFQPMGIIPLLPSGEEQQPRNLSPRVRWLKRTISTTYAMRVSPRSQADGLSPRFSGARTSNQSMNYLYHGGPRLSTCAKSVLLSAQGAWCRNAAQAQKMSA